MNSKNILALLLTFFSVTLSAQTFFKPGYVIKSTGDTLTGQVDYRGGALMSKRCTFRRSNKDSIIHFSPNEILGYRFPDSKYYISKVVNGRKVFLEYLINGKVSVYYLKDEWGEDHYFIEKDSLGIAEIPYEEGIREKEGQNYVYTPTRYLGLLTYYMQDAAGLQPKIMKLKKPEHDNLIALAKDYHHAICNDDKCIIYEKKLPAFKVDLEAIVGQIYVDNAILGKYSFPRAGILAHVWMPLVNENLFLKTGILLPLKKQSDSLDYSFEIPFQIEYIYPQGIIRPKIAIGTNLPFLTFDISPGLNVKLTKWLFLTASFNIGLLPYTPSDMNSVLKISKYTTSFSTGLYFKL